MDSKQIIKKYIMPRAWVRIGGILCALILIATLAMGFVAMNQEVAEPVEFFPSETPTGTMAYIDVVGLSDWVYQYDDMVYYSAEDAEGYLYTVRLKDSQVKAMAAQQTYWNRETESEPVPQPYHLVGYVQTTTDTMKENLSSAWAISVAEYDQYFGTLFLNCTTSVAAEKSAGWSVGALFSGLFALLCLVFQCRAASMSKKCLKVLEERCLLDKAAQQLENTEEHQVIGKNRGIMTRDFIFGRGTGAVVAYSDVIWAYQQNRRSNFVVTCSYLMVATPWMNAEGIVDMNNSDRDGHLATALMTISQHNPDALIGYNSANRKAAKAARKANN